MKFFSLIHAVYADKSNKWWLAFIIPGGIHNVYITAKEAKKMKKYLPIFQREIQDGTGIYFYYGPKTAE